MSALGDMSKEMTRLREENTRLTDELRRALAGELCCFVRSDGRYCGKPKGVTTHATLGMDHGNPTDDDHYFQAPATPAAEAPPQ